MMGSVNVGGIAGGSYLGVIIDGCHSTAAVSGSLCVGGVLGNLGNNSFLMACYSTGDVTVTSTDGSFVGGVVGTNSQGTVTGCYHATGEITSSVGDRIGGIVGKITSELSLPATGTAISAAAPVLITARMTLIRWTALTLPGRRQLPP